MTAYKPLAIEYNIFVDFWWIQGSDKIKHTV